MESNKVKTADEILIEKVDVASAVLNNMVTCKVMYNSITSDEGGLKPNPVTDENVEQCVNKLLDLLEEL